MRRLDGHQPPNKATAEERDEQMHQGHPGLAIRGVGPPAGDDPTGGQYEKDEETAWRRRRDVRQLGALEDGGRSLVNRPEMGVLKPAGIL